MQHRLPSLASPAPTTLSLSIGLLLCLPAFVAADPLPAVKPAAPPDASRAAVTARLAVPLPEPENAGSSLASPFTSGKAAVPNVTGQTLTAPVTVNANTSADAMTVNQAGTGRAISGVITNAQSAISALKGTTNGTGAALAGQNTGTTGPAGQFQITNTSSSQAGLVSSTTGTGNAIQAIQGNTGSTDTPAILGQHIGGPAFYGVGVEGDGNDMGVVGVSANIGVYGNSTTGSGVYGNSSKGHGVTDVSSNEAGVYGVSTKGYGVYAASSGSVGIYASSDSTYAGIFHGEVYVSSEIYAQSYGVSSDRNVKQGIQPVDTERVLDRVAAMPISSWDFQTRPGIHHIGPMAQDFRAAFGLGTDDRHIDLVDGVGVSLAAIQELQRQSTAKDARAAEDRARIASLEAQVIALQTALGARLSALEHGAAVVATAVP